jgi:GTPase
MSSHFCFHTTTFFQEYVRPGMRMLFRDGRVRGVGLVTAIPTVQPVH